MQARIGPVKALVDSLFEAVEPLSEIIDPLIRRSGSGGPHAPRLADNTLRNNKSWEINDCANCG